MATKSKTHQDWLDALRKNRKDSQEYAAQTSTMHVLDALGNARDRLNDQLDALDYEDGESFSSTQYRLMLDQVEDVIQELVDDLTDQISGDAVETAERAANDVLQHIADAEESFRGLGEFTGLPIDEAMMFDQAVNGANASVLRRLGGDPDDPDDLGIMSRYGINTIGDFENIFRDAMLAGTPMEDLIDDLTDASPFLQGAPRFWAERIARTETMNAYNHASWESLRNIEDQTGEEMIKIVVEIDDDRTAWDSYAVHGQLRRMDEPFEFVNYHGETEYYMYPPNRPNDRATVVSWNPAWGPIPDEMQPFDDEMYIAAWYEVYRKKSPPSRPTMSTLTPEETDRLWNGEAQSQAAESE